MRESRSSGDDDRPLNLLPTALSGEVKICVANLLLLQPVTRRCRGSAPRCLSSVVTIITTPFPPSELVNLL